MNWIKRLFCAHRYEWVRNIYGDEINLSGGKRSLSTMCIGVGQGIAIALDRV